MTQTESSKPANAPVATESGRPTLQDIRVAWTRIRPHIHKTPVMTSETLSRMCGIKLYFKCENFQRVGAFKFRGASNAVLSLTEEEASRGVATHSSGNHAAALALAASQRGIKAYIVMPKNSPIVKQEAVRGYGGIITLCESTLESRETTTQKIIEETGAALIHPFNNDRIIAGQGTCALEFIDEVGELDMIMAPVGGGGLMSGTAIATKGLLPRAKVIAAEPEMADDAFRSMQAGSIQPLLRSDTIADGLRTSLGDKTFPVIHELVDQVVTVTEDAIRKALRLVLERMKIVIEPSAAVPVAAVMEGKLDVKGKRVGIILSGGNLDFSNLPL